MLRIVGACCILAGCGWFGFNKGEEFRQRTVILRHLQNGLNLLETEISYGQTPLPVALTRIATKLKGAAQIPFACSAQLLKDNMGLTAAEAWEEGVRSLNSAFSLTGEDKSILLLFGQGLGCSAREEQLKNIALVQEQLRMAETAAEEARAKNQKMWQALGICSGGVLVLLLI